MPDLLDFLPLAVESIDTVRSRLDADANTGVDPASPAFIDLTEGGLFFDITQALGIEIARLWDFASVDVPAAMFPAFAWGDYLDEHGEALGLERKDAVKATGTLTFTGTDGTEIAVGAEAVIAQDDPDIEPPAFVTTATGTISSGSVDVPVEAVEAGTLGNVTAGAITGLETPINGVSSITNAVGTSGGADVETDEDFRERILLELRGAGGAGTIADYERWALAYPGVGTVAVEPLWDGGGTVRVVVADSENSPVSDTIKFGLQDQLDPPVALTATDGSHTLPTGTIAVDSTGGFADAGDIVVYDQVVSYTAKTAGTFTGCTGGTGTFGDGTRVAQGFGLGRGLAPIGAVVSVDTVTSLTIDVDVTVDFNDGYNADGSGGLIAVGETVVAEIEDYLNSLRPGDDVVYFALQARAFRVTGVEDVTALSVDSGTSNVAVAALEVAKPGTITVS